MRLPKLALTAVLFAAPAMVGCYEEKVDVETPIGDVEVVEDKLSGDVSVSVGENGE